MLKNGFSSGTYSEATKPTNVSDGDNQAWGDYSSTAPPMAQANTQIAVLTSACSVGGNLKGAYISGASNITLESNRTNVQFRIKDENIKFALPTSIRDQFLANPGIIGYMEYDVRDEDQVSSGTVPTCIQSPIVANKYKTTDTTFYECVIVDNETELTINVKDSPLWNYFSTKSNDFYFQQRDVLGYD